MAGQKIRIRLKAYDHEVIDSSAKKIVETVERTGATVAGPVPLPTEKNVYCVIRSPHKYKDSREHFEMRTHKRLIDIIDPTPKTVDSLMRLDLPAGVGSMMSMRRLWVRISKCSRLSLYLCGERMTQYTFFSVGSGTGPATVAPVRSTVSTIFFAEESITSWSYALSLMRIFCPAIFSPSSGPAL